MPVEHRRDIGLSVARLPRSTERLRTLAASSARLCPIARRSHPATVPHAGPTRRSPVLRRPPVPAAGAPLRAAATTLRPPSLPRLAALPQRPIRVPGVPMHDPPVTPRLVVRRYHTDKPD